MYLPNSAFRLSLLAYLFTQIATIAESVKMFTNVKFITGDTAESANFRRLYSSKIRFLLRRNLQSPILDLEASFSWRLNVGKEDKCT